MLQIAFMIAFAVQFLHACTQEGMIFHIVQDKLYDFPSWVKKPLYDCPVCMTIWWGALYLLICTHEYTLGNMVMILFTAGGINVFVSALIEYMGYGIEESTTDPGSIDG